MRKNYEVSNSLNSVVWSFITGLLGIAFIVLKLAHVIDWSWWWVTAPFWGGIVITIVAIIVALIIVRKKEKDNSWML